MAGEPASGAAKTTLRERWLGWLDGPLLTLCLGSLAIVVGSGLVQVSFGAYSIPIVDAWRAVFDPAIVFNHQTWEAFLLGGELPEMDTRSLVVWNIRLPRVLVGILAGLNLAIGGAIFQAVTRNEFASPATLGVSAGAGLAILLTLVIFGSLVTLLPLLAAIGGGVAFLVVYAIAWKDGTSPIRLVLAGIIVWVIASSFQRALFFVANDISVVQSAIAWMTGSLTGTDWEQVRMALPWTVLFVVPGTFAAARQLDVLLLGDSTAASLGMNVERTRFALAGFAVVAVGASIAVAGVISFVGLVVPHVVRTIVGSDHRRLLVGCLFAGPALVVGADVGARLAFSPLQMPVGIVTGVIGGPYFLYLMRKQDAMGEI